MVALLIGLIAVSFICLVAPPTVRMVAMRGKVENQGRVRVAPLG